MNIKKPSPRPSSEKIKELLGSDKPKSEIKTEAETTSETSTEVSETKTDPQAVNRSSYDPDRRKRDKTWPQEAHAGFLGNRIPPNDLEAERITLSAMMQAPASAEIGFRLLDPDSFYYEPHRQLFDLLAEVYKHGRYFDWFTTKKICQERGILESLGGDIGFLELQNAAPNSAMIDEYAAIVKQTAVRRQAVIMATQALALAYDQGCDTRELVKSINELGTIRHEQPHFKSMRQVIQEYPDESEPVIDGLLRRRETMNLIAPSKIGKSHLVMMLTYAVANGGSFLGFQCTKGRVLIIDNELQYKTISARNQRMIQHDADCSGALDNIVVWSLRGDLQNITSICERDLSGFDLIILDAWYRFSDGDENSNTDITKIYNQLDKMAALTDAALIAVHHTSKGNQSGKSTTDVGSGAGAQSRAADAHVVIREHEAEDCFIIDSVVRSFAPPDSFVVQKKYPIFIRRDDLDPKKYAGAASPKSSKQTGATKKTEIDLLGLIPSGADGIPQADLLRQASMSGISFKNARLYLSILEEDGHISIKTESKQHTKVVYKVEIRDETNVSE